MHARDAPSNRSFLPERLQWPALQRPSRPERRDSGRRLRGGLVTERQQRGSWRVHCGGSRRAAASGAPGGLWKADARYTRSTWHGDARWQACRHDGSVSCRPRQTGGPVCAGQERCVDAVRGCPRGPAARSPRARTYSGRRRLSGHHPVAFAQLRWYTQMQAGAGCKTVGSAYVGSNPTPATTSENGPLAADTRQAGRFLLVTPCIVVRHRESMRCGVHGRIADGVHAIRTVGAHRRLFHGRPRTGRAGGVFPGLTRGAESGVHPCVPAGALGGFPGRGAGRGGTGKADALMTKAVRESVTMAGRAERARVARVFTAGVLGPGHPCGDDAALLVSCSATASGTAARARRGRRSRSGPPAAWSGSTSPTAAAGECRSCGPPVMRRKVSGGWVGPAWDARPAAARPQSHGAAL